MAMGPWPCDSFWQNGSGSGLLASLVSEGCLLSPLSRLTVYLVRRSRNRISAQTHSHMPRLVPRRLTLL